MNIYFFTEPESVQLWRYQDPILGPFKLPNFNEPKKDKALIPTDSIFKVDVQNKKVLINIGKEVVEVGTQISYLVV